MSRIWILGAPDPEMEAIEQLLISCGERVAYACASGGERVHAAVAYSGTCHRYVTDCGSAGDSSETWYLVECTVPTPDGCPVVRIDHHRTGDPGFGRPPSEFLAASAIGQVHAVLRVTPTRATMLTAAADHCLGAAYRGECPGVDPDELMRWRVESRARFQNREPSAVLADIEATRAALASAPSLVLRPRSGHCAGRRCGCRPGSYGSGDPGASTSGGTGDCYCGCDDCVSAHESITVLDMRHHEPPLAELPEAACRYGYEYVSGPLVGPDGRRKYTVSGRPETVAAWLGWAAREGLCEAYGDPARGFAGAYEAQS